MKLAPYVRQRSYGFPRERIQAPAGWVAVELPPLPPLVATEVVRYARHCLDEYSANEPEDA